MDICWGDFISALKNVLFMYVFIYLAIFIEHLLSQALCQAWQAQQIRFLSSGDLQLMGQRAINQSHTNNC